MPILNLDLHKQPEVLAFLGQSFSLVEGFFLLATHFDGCVDVED